MSEPEDDLQREIERIAREVARRTDDTKEGLTELAAMLWGYWEALLGVGFTESYALALVSKMSQSFLDRAWNANTKEADDA